MKNRFRLLSALLIAVMTLSLVSAASADPGDAGGIRVYIPNKLERLHVPDMPEYIGLYTRTESVATYGNPKDLNNPVNLKDPCPILAVSEPDIELFFSEQPDWAAVIWAEGTEPIEVNEYGYARVSSAGHKYQPGVTGDTIQIKDEKTGELKRVWATTTADHKAGEDAPTEDGAFLAGKDGVTTLYNRDGSPVWVEFTVNEDFYKTGLYGAVTTVRYERVVISGDRYIFPLDKDGHYIYEPEMRRKTVLKNGQYEYVKDDDGNYIYEPTGKMVRRKHNLKGNVIIVSPDDKNTYYIDTSDYKKLVYYNPKPADPDHVKIEDLDPSDPLDVYIGKITQSDGNVNIKVYNEDGNPVQVYDEEKGEYVYLELNYSYSEFIKVTENHRINLKNYDNAVIDGSPIVQFYYTTWYVSQVVTEYPEDLNYIVRVESDWRNDSGRFLWGYKITYATSPNERYKITYAPNKTTILEDHNTNKFFPASDPSLPSTDLEAFFTAIGEDNPADYHGLYLHHYEEDEPIYGEYTDGTMNLVSGSGDYLKYWFEEGHGARVYRRLYPCTYFKSPRYK